MKPYGIMGILLANLILSAYLTYKHATSPKIVTIDYHRVKESILSDSNYLIQNGNPTLGLHLQGLDVDAFIDLLIKASSDSFNGNIIILNSVSTSHETSITEELLEFTPNVVADLRSELEKNSFSSDTSAVQQTMELHPSLQVYKQQTESFKLSHEEGSPIP